MTNTEAVLVRVSGASALDGVHAVVPFDHGFTVPAEHPIAKKLLEDKEGTHFIVLSTTEGLWDTEDVQVFKDDDGNTMAAVSCVTWADGLRRAYGDDKFLEIANLKTA